MPARADLEALPAGTEALRRIRYLTDADFDDITTDELEVAVRWLRAATHSTREGVRTLERVIQNRRDIPT